MAIDKSSEEYKKFKDLQKNIEIEQSFKEIEADIKKISKK